MRSSCLALDAVGNEVDCHSRRCFPALIAGGIHSAVRAARACRSRSDLDLGSLHWRTELRRRACDPACRFRDDGRRRWSARHLRPTNQGMRCRDRRFKASQFWRHCPARFPPIRSCTPRHRSECCTGCRSGRRRHRRLPNRPEHARVRPRVRPNRVSELCSSDLPASVL